VSYGNLFRRAGAGEWKMHAPGRTTSIDQPVCVGTIERPITAKSIVIPEQYVVTLHDVVAVPRQLLVRGREILPDSFRRGSPRHAHRQLERISEQRFRSKTAIEPQDTIAEPVFYLDGEHMSHFGHFTLEVLSRLWYWKEYARMSESRPRVVCSSVRDFTLELLKPFGIAQQDIHILDKPTLLKNVTIASQGYVLESGVTEDAFDAWRTIGDFYGAPPGPSRIYVSRSNWQKQRILRNEAQVEAIFREHGFEIVYPEMLSIAQQVALFRTADIVAGPSGSGLYNCVYCSKSGQRIILASSKFVTPNDTLVNLGTNSRITYITGTPAAAGSGMFADWDLDTAMLERCLRDLLPES
jgi:capsular polysaccharide biosynthesis protein